VRTGIVNRKTTSQHLRIYASRMSAPQLKITLNGDMPVRRASIVINGSAFVW
jgi:hypothetical protein